MSSQKITVIGSGVGGLCAAALLSQQGLRVRVLEKASTPGGKCSVRKTSSGFLFDEGPSILVLKQIYEDFFSRAGRRMSDYLHFETLDPAFSISTASGQKFHIHADFEKTLASLSLIDSGAALELQALVHRVERFAQTLGLAYADRAYESVQDVLRLPLMKSGLQISPLRKYKNFVDSSLQSPLLREFLYGFPGYAGAHPENAPASMILLPWSILREGVFYPRGGVSAIVEALYKVCLENGVEFIFDCEVQKVQIVRGRIDRVSCKIREKEFFNLELDRSERVVFNGDLSCFSKNLAPELFAPSEQQNLAQQSPSFFTLQMGVSAEWLSSQKLAHHNLFLPQDLAHSYQDFYVPGSPYPQNPPLYLNIPSVSDASVAPVGKANLFLVVSVPSHLNGQKAGMAQEMERYGRHCVRLLQNYLPDFPQQPEPFYCKGSQQFETDLNQMGGQIYGPSLDTAQIMGGLFRPHPKLHQLSNCYLVGTSTQPGAGLPMVLQSGKIVADLIFRENAMVHAPRI